MVGAACGIRNCTLGSTSVLVERPSDIAELSNVLIVINDLDLEQHAQASLKAIGIEDLIAAQVVGCSMLRTPFSEAASLTRVLVGLAREGVGGRFRAGYLHRRVAWDTDGAVVLERELSGEAVECDLAPRFTTLTRMQALISPGKSGVASRSIGRVSLRNVYGMEKRPSRIVTATESGKGRGEPAP